MVTCQGRTCYWNYLGVYWPCAGGLSAVNVPTPFDWNDTFNMPTSYFIPIVGVGKRGAYQLVYGGLPRQHPLLELPWSLLALCRWALGSERTDSIRLEQHFQHAHFILHTNSGCGKERRISIGLWWPAKAAPVTGTTLEFTGPVPVGSRQ